MRKVDLEFDNTLVDKYINEIQSHFPDYNITLENVNDFGVILSERSNCRNCVGLDLCQNANRGHVMDYLEDRFVFKECDKLKASKMANNKSHLIKTLYLPTKILEARIEDFDINTESREKIYNKIKKFITNFNTAEREKGLYLHGTCSIGKTFTLGCIANELAKNNISCLLIYFPDLVLDLKNAIGTPRFESLLNMLKSIDVLMLDDFGSENMTPWLRDEVLGPVVNYRVLDNKPVFISSNITPNNLKAHLAIDKSQASELKGERLLSRLNALMSTIDMNDSNKYSR